ncbi:MAG: tRNA-dihydrouridine synthase, partial [Pseudomonadales bacterium]|nr:tRNA-dihydrouridine synthase [Pseudomonadales bacterium]
MLAPMEGVVEHTMRRLYAQLGGIDRFVTEFIRVGEQTLPPRVFYRYCPELRQIAGQRSELASSKRKQTAVPTYTQLLGDNPESLARNAMKLTALGSPGIDLNFGCPAKTVNKSCGGAFLLQYPDSLYQIVSQVRQAVPAKIPVSAKIRLGFDDDRLATDIVSAISSAGANEIVIHARTKKQGYKPPAHWEKIAMLKQYSAIPIIANGEIWTYEQLVECMQASQCQRIMLGRGLLASPDLAIFSKNPAHQPFQFGEIVLLLNYYYQLLKQSYPPNFRLSLIKQWLCYLRAQYAKAYLLFESIKRIRCADQLELTLKQALQHANAATTIRTQLG